MTNFIHGETPTISQAFELTPISTKAGTRIYTGCTARSPRQWLLARSAPTALDVAA